MKVRVLFLLMLIVEIKTQMDDDRNFFLNFTTTFSPSDIFTSTNGETPPTESHTPPHIIFIMVDDLGWNDVGYHGSEIRTPHMDNLAENGVKLENYYTAPVCGPTRAQFLSGKYSIHMGTHRGNTIACEPTGLPTQFPTIADKLKEQGYNTHLIGKWHAGFHTEDHLPTSRGFDTFRGFLLGHGDHYTHTRQYQGKKYLDFYDNTTPYNQSWGHYSTEVFTERAKEIIEESKDTSKPMFMFLSYQAPHNPLQVPSEYLDGYEHIQPESRRKYAAMVTAIDEGVGQVVESLKRSGMYDNSVIIFSTDNGGDVGSAGSNFPLRGNKGSLYQGGIRAIGFVSSPIISAAKRSREVTDLIHVTDWMPTLLHIAGGSLNSNDLIDGVNQWNTISNAERSERKEILHNIKDRPRFRRGRGRRSRIANRKGSSFDTWNVRVVSSLTYGPWKILTGGQARDIVYPNPANHPFLWRDMLRLRPRSRTGIQVYNIVEDPQENNNLLTARPDITTLLLSRLKFYENSIAPAVVGRHDTQCHPENRGGVWGPYIEARRA